MAGSNLMYTLSQGNPGALSVVSRLNYADLARLERTSLRGSLIWIGYKDICGEDITEFKNMLNANTIEEKVKATPDYKYMKKEGLL